MSAATEFPPIVHIPARARVARSGARPAGPWAPATVRRRPAAGGLRVVAPAVEAVPAVVLPAPASSPVAAPARPVQPVRRPVARPRVRVRPVGSADSCVAAGPAPFASASSAVRLTRRGWTLLLGAGAVLAAVLVWVALLSHPAAPAGAGAAPAPSAVTVQAGDTLWSIAARVAPDRDPRAVVYDLQHVNHLTGVTLTPGQVLRTH